VSGAICSGTRWISGAVFSDVTAIQKKGKKTTMAPQATRANEPADVTA
jgi:hypothetical protein